MNPGDTVTLYGEEVVILSRCCHKATVYGTGWNGTRRVDLEALRRLLTPTRLHAGRIARGDRSSAHVDVIKTR